MIIKKYSDIKIDFYGLKYLENPPNDELDIPIIPPWTEVHSFNFTKELLPDICHISCRPSHTPDHPDVYEIDLHYYRLHGHSKPVMEKYFEYFITYDENSKPIQETFPEIMV